MQNVFLDENGNLYVAVFHKRKNVWVIWNAEEKYLGFIPAKDAAHLLQDLEAL